MVVLCLGAGLLIEGLLGISGSIPVLAWLGIGLGALLVLVGVLFEYVVRWTSEDE